MRVAAVQLNSSADPAANLAVADRLTRAAAADGARLIVLPEKWTAMGSDEELRAAAETLDGPGDRMGARDARELGVDLIAGSIVERVEGREKLANTSVHVDPRGELKAVYRKVHMFDVEVGGRVYRESDLEEPGEEIVLSRDRRGRGAGAVDLLRPALPRALPDPRRARRPRVPAAGRLHAGDHARSLGDAGAGARDREPGVRDRGQPDRLAPRRQPLGRALDDRRPVGVVLAQAPDGEGHIVAELDLERQREIRAQLPALANRRPRSIAGPRRCARERQPVSDRLAQGGAGQAPR